MPAEAALKLEITFDSHAAIEAMEFLMRHEQRIKQDEPLRERLQDMLDHEQMVILIPAPEKRLHYILEPSYLLLELMAELAR